MKYVKQTRCNNYQARQCTYQRNIVGRSHKYLYRGKNRHIYSDCLHFYSKMFSRKSYAPYYVVCSLSGCTEFFHISHKLHVFRKKVFEYKMCVLIFSITFMCNIFHSKKNTTRYYNKCKHVFTYRTLFLPHFNKTSIFIQIFEEYSNVKLLKVLPVVSRRQTDEHYKANSRFLTFSEGA
jgi:hypothetical protein